MVEEEKTRVTGVLELVMKCLWKLTKQVPQLVETRSLDLKELLHQIHETLKQIPPSEYKKSAAKYPNKDLPVRTVKTLLSELTGCLGQDIIAYIDSDDLNESNIVMNYVEQALEAKRKKALLAGESGAGGEDQQPRSAASTLSSNGDGRTMAEQGPSDSGKELLSKSGTREQLAQDLQGLKNAINASELPVDSSISGLPASLQTRIRSQVAGGQAAPAPAVSESDRRQEKFLELKRLMTSTNMPAVETVRETKTYADFSPSSNGSATDVSPASQEVRL